MVIKAANFAICWVNDVPTAGGVSKMLSPRAIVMGQQPDYGKHFHIPFSAYAQMHDKPKPSNSMTPHTSVAISLGRGIQVSVFVHRKKVVLRVEDLVDQVVEVKELLFGDRNNYMNDNSEGEDCLTDGGEYMMSLQSRTNSTSSDESEYSWKDEDDETLS
eukprot:15354339-Ditylum_brightwellii.AAC.2